MKLANLQLVGRVIEIRWDDLCSPKSRVSVFGELVIGGGEGTDGWRRGCHG